MKRKLIAMILTMCMILSMGSIGAYAQDSQAETEYDNDALRIYARVDDVWIPAGVLEGEYIFFLPASAKLDQLSLVVNDTAADYEVKIENNETVLHVNTEDRMETRVTVLKGEEIPTVYLTSDKVENNRVWVDSDKNNKAKGQMKITDAEGTVLYDGALSQIKTRGNTTFAYYPKKSYQIKLDTKTDLLQVGEKVKTWVLLAAYGDATLIHDKLFKDLALDLGMGYSPQSQWVNLFYDGVYRGVYLLGEKISVEKAGVDITNMEDAYEELNDGYGDNVVTGEAINTFGSKYIYVEGLKEPEDITGGYLIEKNHAYPDEINGFVTTRDAGFNMKTPEYAGEEAMKYISEYYQEFEDAVYATDKKGNYTGYNEKTGKYYYEYCDLESLVQTYLIQQLALNVDAYLSSFFFYKDQDGLMYAGPVWDMDMTCGTGWTEYINYKWEFIPLTYLGGALSKIPHFQAVVKDYYYNYFEPEVDALVTRGGVIETYADQLKANAAMNYTYWPYYVRIGYPGVEQGHAWPEGTTYDDVIRDLDWWLTNRFAELNNAIYDWDDLKVGEPGIAKKFADVKETHWAKPSIDYVSSRKIFAGVASDRFGLDSKITQGMMFTVMAHMAGEEIVPEAGEAWYQLGCDWAEALEICVDTKPMQEVSREEVALYLHRMAGLPESDGSLERFSDADEVGSAAVDAMKWATSSGVFSGTASGELMPKKVLTRAELACVVQNYMMNVK